MRHFTFILTILVLTSCNQATQDSDQANNQKTAEATLLALAQQDMEKTQGASFDIDLGSIIANRYVVDTTHSSVQFRVKHWGIYDVVGRFDSYEMVVYYDKDDFTDLVVEARLRPASINMPNKEMAHHLKTEGFGFFDANTHPLVIFKSTKMEMMADSLYKLTGDMTIKETTKEVVFDVKLNGYTHPPTKSMPGFTISGKINRMDFSLGGTDLLPGNGLPMIGNEVYITSNVRLIRNYD